MHCLLNTFLKKLPTSLNSSTVTSQTWRPEAESLRWDYPLTTHKTWFFSVTYTWFYGGACLQTILPCGIGRTGGQVYCVLPLNWFVTCRLGSSPCDPNWYLYLDSLFNETRKSHFHLRCPLWLCSFSFLLSSQNVLNNHTSHCFYVFIGRYLCRLSRNLPYV